MPDPTSLASHAPDHPIVLTVGKFDGVHIAHQHLLARMRRRAAELHAQTAVMILHPNPLLVLRPEAAPLALTTLADRIALLHDQGIHHILVEPFTRELAQTSADDFIARILRHLRVVELWEGPGFALGRHRQGTLPYLSRLGEELGFSVHAVAPFSLLGEAVSTSHIRHLLAQGDVARAAWLLGRWHALAGEVIHGAKRGRDLGYPTANLDIPADLMVPAHGIYAVGAALDGEPHPLLGVASIGVRPTFDNGPRSVEVYLLDFDRDIYGRTLHIEFVARLREERKFESVDALIEQMGRDVALGREILTQADAFHL